MTVTEREIVLDSIPGMGTMLFKAATNRKKEGRDPEFLPLTVRVDKVRADARKLAKFRDVCGFPTGPYLPLTYPHILAFALHMQLMLEPEFPFSPIGAVHINNRIRQKRAIGVDEAMDLRVRLGDSKRVAKGYEIGFITEVSVEGELIWDDLSVMLVRKGGTGQKQDKPKTHSAPAFQDAVTWKLAANKGRQYAAASGDYNPIHLYPLSARMMGFKRQIMHGMWSKSRAVAHLLPGDYAGPVSVDVAFKLPIFLPATVILFSDSNDTGSKFAMKDGKGEKPHLAGELRMGQVFAQ